MLRTRTIGTSRLLGVVALALAVLVGPLATDSGAAGGVSSSSQLAPDLVTAGRTAFYSATWVNEGPATLTNSTAVITVPAGSALQSATPGACAAPQPADPSDPLVVTCPQGNLRAGAAVTQQLLVRMPTVTSSGSAAVTAVLKADEQASDTEKAHTDTFPAPDRSLTLVPGEADAAGGCLRDGDAALATRPVLGTDNPLITSAGLTGPSGVVCVPLTVRERAGASPTEACAAGATCTTDIAVTEFVPVTLQAPASPIQLTFSVIAGNKNMTWYKNGQPVVDCPGAIDLPARLSGCVNSRSKASSRSVRLGVLWR